MNTQKNSKRMTVGTVALVAMLSTASAFAADPMTSATGGDLKGSDRTFVTKAAIGGMTEVQASQLAGTRASSQSVKDFATRMIGDHEKAAAELTKIAASKNVTTPGTLDKSHKSDVDKLAKLSGADFDKAYMKQMTSDHKTTVSDFEKEAKSGKDADLKNFASTTLPTLQAHLDMAKSTTDALK